MEKRKSLVGLDMSELEQMRRNCRRTQKVCGKRADALLTGFLPFTDPGPLSSSKTRPEPLQALCSAL